jgi:DNA-directed RNA polymerase specialized sigma24 family protein
MQEQDSNVVPVSRHDPVGRCEEPSLPTDTASLIRRVLRAAHVRAEFHAELGDRLHDKLVDQVLKSGMPHHPMAWLFTIACRECAEHARRRAHLRGLEADDANLVAPRARDEPAEEPADEPAEGLRQELLKLAIQLPPHFQRTIHAALSLRDWAEFCSALGTDSSHAERALLRAAKAIARRRGAEEPRSRGAETRP